MKTIRNTFLLLSLFVLSMSSANAQDFQGNWDGSLAVTSGGENVDLPFKMTIYTDNNGNCQGQSRLWINIDGTMYYAQYSFTGTYSGSSLKFSDNDMIEHDSPSSSDFYWCKKSGTLYLNDKTLTGDITGYSPKGDCMPARATLKFFSEAE